MEMAPVELVALASEAVRTAAAVGPAVARAVLGGASRRGDRRQGPPAPGPRQPVGQRAGAHAAGDDGHGARRPDRRPGADRGAGHRPRHAATRTPGASSSASTGPTRRGHAPEAAAGWDCPSSPPSWRPTAGPSRRHRRRVRDWWSRCSSRSARSSRTRTRLQGTSPPNPPPDRPPPAAASEIHTGSTAELHGAPRPQRHHGCHDSPGSLRSRRRSPPHPTGRRDRRAGLQRGATAGGAHHRPAYVPRRVVPLPGAHHRGRQRQHGRHRPGGPPTGRDHAAAWPPCTCPARDAATRCAPPGRRATPRSSPTWTSTSRPRCRRSSRWWRRCCPVTATSPSARGWRRARRWCAARSES